VLRPTFKKLPKVIVNELFMQLALCATARLPFIFGYDWFRWGSKRSYKLSGTRIIADVRCPFSFDSMRSGL
jgi:hypothetical protein